MKQQGIVTPMVTPLRGRDALDEAGLERLIEWLLVGGVHGLFPLGSTGEAPSLPPGLRREVMRRVIELAAGRVPVWVGISDTCVTTMLSLGRAAAEAGAAGVVLTAPYYYPMTQEELLRAVRAVVSELPLPVMLYNMPGCTKIWFEVDTLRRLAAEQRIVGLKDSGGDVEYFARAAALRTERPDWFFLVGPARLLVESMRRGGDGGVCAASHLFPRLLVAGYETARGGDAPRAERLQGLIEDVGATVRIGPGTAGSIRGIKCALAIRAICGDRMAEPFQGPDSEARRGLEAQLNELTARIEDELGSAGSP